MPTIAITGAGSGLGRALAHQYADNGFTVYLLGRSDKRLHMVKHEILEKGNTAIGIPCDVREPASVEIAFRQLEDLDVFIANAGVGIFGPVEECTVKDIDNTLDTNIKGTILTVQAALPAIRKNNGRILTIISTAGLRGKVNESIYCASKYAIKGFTESLQKELDQESCTISAVYMGGMDTPFWNDSSHVKNPAHFRPPSAVAKQIFQEDNGRKEIFIDH